jgi:hypothetical protein
MEVADRISLEPLALWLVLIDHWQPTDAVALQAPGRDERVSSGIVSCKA